MVEQKDVHSYPPARASKSQTVELPSRGGHWNLPKKATPSRKTKKLKQDVRRGTTTIKSNPTGLQGQIPWGFLVPLLDPRLGSLTLVSEPS